MQVIDNAGGGIALVTDHNDAFRGIITDSDIRRAILNGKSLTLAVKEVMNCNPIISNTKDPEFLNNLLLANPHIPARIPIINEQNKIIDLAMIMNPINKNWSFISNNEQKVRGISRILIIGGAGYIGNVLTRKLLEKGYKVTILDRFLYGKEPIKELEANQHLTIIEGDTQHIEILTEAIKDADAVVHLAELVGDPACAINTRETLQTNYLATNLIANACKFFQINRFVYTSSCSVYGDSKGEEKLTEESPLKPVSVYAQMKIEAEKVIMGLKDDNFSPCILRLSTVFGLSPRMRFDLVINTLTIHAAKRKKISIFGGDQWRPFVHVSDVAEAIITVLESPIDKIKGQIFNVGSNNMNLKIKDLGSVIANGFPNVSVDVKDDIPDKRDYNVSFNKISRILGFNTKISTEEGIAEIKNSIQKGEFEDWESSKYNNYKFLVEKNNLRSPL